MSQPSGPSHFVEVTNVAYDGINIYSCSNIRLQRQREILKGEDNNKTRPVSSHTVRIKETISFETEDGYAALNLLAETDAHDLTFTWVRASQQLTSSPMENQAVTIKNVVIEEVDDSMLSKGLGKAMVRGTVLGVSDDSDPVVFANGTSSSSS